MVPNAFSTETGLTCWTVLVIAHIMHSLSVMLLTGGIEGATVSVSICRVFFRIAVISQQLLFNWI